MTVATLSGLGTRQDRPNFKLAASLSNIISRSCTRLIDFRFRKNEMFAELVLEFYILYGVIKFSLPRRRYTTICINSFIWTCRCLVCHNSAKLQKQLDYVHQKLCIKSSSGSLGGFNTSIPKTPAAPYAHSPSEYTYDVISSP